ncbi:MAG: hypothetical protein AAGN64_08620, partial [Bacteroidota bacterium]
GPHAPFPYAAPRPSSTPSTAMRFRLAAVLFFSVALSLCWTTPHARAQSPVRFGAGFDALLTPPSQDIVTEGLGVGGRFRMAFPLNADLSFAAGAGVFGYVFKGRDDAAYLFNPQLSVIVTTTRGSANRYRYLMGGIGYFAALTAGTDAEGGPALHFGLGWATPLNDTSLYFEVDPALIIGEENTTFAVPVRVGVIF